MSLFRKNAFTEPVICKHESNISKDWYVFFRFKHNGQLHKFKRREGVNRIKILEERIIAIDKLRGELEYDLNHGWNPILDPKRELSYNPYHQNEHRIPKKVSQKRKTETEIYLKYFNL